MADQDQQNFDVNESAEKQKIVRGKKRTSPVWNHYDLITKIDGPWAIFKYCKHEMKADGYVGTTNPRRHMEKCDAYAKFVETNPDSNVVYDHDTYIRMFAESIIYHGYALSMVEHIKTRDLHRYLNPKLREVVRFIDSFDVRLSAFDKAILDCGDRTSFRGKLVLDVTTRWNSTYNMIRRALDAKEAIDLYILRERELEMIFDEEWETIGNIFDFLEPFYDITELFSGTQYLTSNSYLACIIHIEKLLYDSHKDPSNAVRKMAKPKWEKFDKYWFDHSLILSFGLLLDPRYKMACLNDLYSSLYVPIAVEGKINEIHIAFVALYGYYAKNSQAHVVVQDSLSGSGPSNLNRPFKAKRILKNFNPHSCSSRTAKSDVDSYLNLPFVVDHDGFNILEYWKAQSMSYPTLALMARDILAIPITSVASESAFSAGGRILNKLRSSLLPKNVEILVTKRSWLFGFEAEENDEEVLSVARETIIDDVANE
ncbi:putative AC transposase [Bienertia sinuspersici]